MTNITEFYDNNEISKLPDSLLTMVQETFRLLNIENSLLEVNYVSNDEIRELNKRYRKIDKSTDVLSFPQPEILGRGVRLLGTIVIAPAVVEEKDERIEDVIKHGILHLLGFDHESDPNSWEKVASIINCEL
ncbi:MAG TPA: rRNA maturation RNase YbeY [bacterium]|nr:rRNA maturation RNase YbeY [bacterium]